MRNEKGWKHNRLINSSLFHWSLYDEKIKTMVKPKRCINTPMAQLVEIALEEECAIKIQETVSRKGTVNE